MSAAGVGAGARRGIGETDSRRSYCGIESKRACAVVGHTTRRTMRADGFCTLAQTKKSRMSGTEQHKAVRKTVSKIGEERSGVW